MPSFNFTHPYDVSENYAFVPLVLVLPPESLPTEQRALKIERPTVQGKVAYRLAARVSVTASATAAPRYPARRACTPSGMPAAATG